MEIASALNCNRAWHPLRSTAGCVWSLVSFRPKRQSVDMRRPGANEHSIACARFWHFKRSSPISHLFSLCSCCMKSELLVFTSRVEPRAPLSTSSTDSALDIDTGIDIDRFNWPQASAGQGAVPVRRVPFIGPRAGASGRASMAAA